ncbi:MAG: SIR2 family protein [Balneola sp.]
MRTIERIIRDNNLNEVAFFIGNGVNHASSIMPSWAELLDSITREPFEKEGLTYTEIYDIIELSRLDHKDLKHRIVNELQVKDSDDLGPHYRLMDLAKGYNAPVLTTNFDNALEKSIGAELFRTREGRKGFTHFYPWDSYYGLEKFTNPRRNFGIWHVHGMVKYADSIRLGLTDYMGAVQKARELVHRGDDRLFEGKRTERWDGYHTWLHIWFNSPMIFFGFGFGADEVFLRWLLIERRKYFRIFNDDMQAWFISTGETDIGTINLMQNLGVKIVHELDYDNIYG